MFACFAHGEQQTNEPESQTPTQNLSPLCWLSARFWKAIWRLVLKPNCYSSVFVEQRGYTCLPPAQLKRCPQPLGKWYNEDPYAYALSHFNCKRCTHPALWNSDGCIMSSAQNMTIMSIQCAASGSTTVRHLAVSFLLTLLSQHFICVNVIDLRDEIHSNTQWLLNS